MLLGIFACMSPSVKADKKQSGVRLVATHENFNVYQIRDENNHEYLIVVSNYQSKNVAISTR